MAGACPYSKPNWTPRVRDAPGNSGHTIFIESVNSSVIPCPKKTSAQRRFRSREMPVSFRHEIPMVLGTI